MEQDIIEKKPSSPVATSLLVISACALIAGMVFQTLELMELAPQGRTLETAAQDIAREKFSNYDNVTKGLGLGAAKAEKSKE